MHIPQCMTKRPSQHKLKSNFFLTFLFKTNWGALQRHPIYRGNLCFNQNIHNQPSCEKILSAILHHGFPINNLSKSIINTSAQKLLLQFKTLNHTKKVCLL